MQRKIIPDAENRLLILYALKTVGAMTDQQLLIVMTDTDLMNYITLQLTIADLESEGKLRRHIRRDARTDRRGTLPAQQLRDAHSGQPSRAD